METVEIWKSIPKYERTHIISNSGIVKTIDRVVYKSGSPQNIKGKTMSVRIDRDGYCKCTLQENKIRKSKSVHRLVAMTFIDNPNNKSCVNHIDGNKKNNTVENLEWCTVKENNQHAFDIGLKENSHSTGENCNFSKLTKIQVADIRKGVSKKLYNQRKASKIYKVSEATISMIINNKIWK